MDKHLRHVRCLELQDIRDLGPQLQTRVSYTTPPFYYHVQGKTQQLV
jgi:hypothetical protein